VATPYNTQIDYLTNLRDVGIINPQEYLKRLDTSYRMKPNLFSEEDLDYIEKEHKKYDIKWNRDLQESGASLLSVVNQFTSGLVEGFTTIGWADEPDTAVERIAGSFGHLLGFAPDVIASVLSGGRYIPIAAAKQASKKSQKAVREGISKVASKSPSLLRKEISPNTFALRSIPMLVADKVLEHSKAALGSTNLTSLGFLSRGLLGKASVRNAAHQAVHLGVALGVSSWKDGPKAMIDATMHGAAAGAIFGSIGNYVRIGDMLRSKDTAQMGREAVKLASRQLYQDPNKYEAIEMLMKGSLGASFQGGLTTLQGAPLPDQIYEYLLGFFFGASAKSAGFMNRTKFINQRFFPSNENISRVKEKWQADPEYQALPKVDRQYIDSYLDSIRRQQLNIINSDRPSWAQGLSQTIKDIAKEKNIDLTEPITIEKKIILDNEQKKIEKIKTPKKDTVDNEGINVQMPEIPKNKEETFKMAYRKETGTETKNNLVASINSGMQSGADYGGLKGGKRRGAKTGGWITSDFKTKISGSKKQKDQLIKDYGLKLVTEPITVEVERGKKRTFPPESYPNRTIRNVNDNDATVIFALPEHIDKSVGTNKTIGYASEGKWVRGSSKKQLKSASYLSGYRPHIIITGGYKSKKMADIEAQNLTDFILNVTKKNNGKIPNINIAGHGNDRVPGNKTWKSFEDYVDYIVDKSLEGKVETSPIPPNVDNGGVEITASNPRPPKTVKDYAKERMGDYKHEISKGIEEIENASSDHSSKTILSRPTNIAAEYIVSQNKKLRLDTVKLEMNDLIEKSTSDIKFFEKLDIKFGVSIPENIRKELGRAYLIKRNLKEQTDHGIQNLKSFKKEPYKEEFNHEQFPSEDIDGTILVKYRTENKHDRHVKGTVEDVSYILSSVQIDQKQGRAFKTIDNVQGPILYKMEYKPILTHQVPKGKKEPITGKKAWEYTLTKEGLDAINQKLEKDGYYVSRAYKDKGVLEVTPYAISEKNPYKDNYLSKDDQVSVLKELWQSDRKPKTDVERKTLISNLYYLLREHSLKGIKGHGKITADSLIKGIREVRANDNQKLNYKDVVEYNKYASLDWATNIPLNRKDYNIYDAGSKTKAVYVPDLPAEVHKVIMLGNTDSVHLRRQDVFDAVAKRHYIDAKDDKIKLTAFRGARNDVNLIKNKIGTERVSDALDKLMHKFNIHDIFYESGGKTNKGNFNLARLRFNEKTKEYFFEGGINDKNIVDYNWNEWYIDLGVRQNSSHMNRGASVGKQLYDSISMSRIRGESIERGDRLDKAVSDWIDLSNAGDPVLGTEIINNFRAGKELTRDFDIHMVPEDVIIEMKNDVTRGGIDNPVFKQVLKKIVESNELDISSQVWDPQKSADLKKDIMEQYQVSEILNMHDYDPLVFTTHPYKDFINKALFRHLVNKKRQPRDPDAFQTTLNGLNAEELVLHKPRKNQGPNKIRTGVGDGLFMMGRDVRDKPVRIPQIKAIKTMGQAWDMLRNTKLDKTEAIAIQEVLDGQVLLRVPNSAVSGARVPRFGGFVNRDGIGLYVGPKDKYYMDGADNDFDEAFVFRNIPKELREEFARNQEFLKDEKGELINLETPPDWLIKDGYFTPYEAKTSNDVLIDMVTPWPRLEAGRSAAVGKESMGGAINSLDRQLSVMDAVINTKITEPSREIPYMLVNVTKTDNKQNAYFDNSFDHRIVLLDGKGKPMTSTNLKDYDVLLKQFEVDALKIKNGYADSPKYLNIPSNFQIAEMTWNKYFRVQRLSQGVWKDLGKHSSISWLNTTSTQAKYKNKAGKWIPVRKIQEIQNLADTYKLIHGMPSMKEINESPRVFNEFISNPNYRYDLQVYNTAKKLADRTDWTIDSFEYLQSYRGFEHLYDNSIEPYDFVLRMTTELQKRLINSKYFDKYGLIPNYRHETQAIFSLKRSGNFMFKNLKDIANKNYKTLAMTPTREIENHFDNALNLNVADYVSDMFITKVAKSRLTEMNVHEAFNLIKDIQTRVNQIKETWYYGSNNFRDNTGYTVPRERLDYKWINQELAKLKVRYNKIPSYKPFIKDIELVIDAYLKANPRFRFKELANKTTEDLMKLVNNHSRYIANKLTQKTVDGKRKFTPEQLSALTPETYDKFSKDNNLLKLEQAIRFREDALNVLFQRISHFDRTKMVKPENRIALLKLKKEILSKGLESVNKNVKLPKETSDFIRTLYQTNSADQILDINTVNNKKIVKTKQEEVDTDIKKFKKEQKKLKVSKTKKIYGTDPEGKKKVIGEELGDVDNIFGTLTSQKEVLKGLARKFRDKKQDPDVVKQRTVSTIKRAFKKPFSFLERLDSNILEPITPENQKVLDAFRGLIEKHPQVLENLDWYFGKFTKDSEGIVRDLASMNSKEALLFVKQLERSFKPMTGLVGRDGKFKEKPRKSDHVWFYDYAGERLGFMESDLELKPMLENKMMVNGDIKSEYMEQPMSSLQLIKEHIDFTDTITKAARDNIEKTHVGHFGEILTSDSKELARHRKLLEEHAINSIEYLEIGKNEKARNSFHSNNYLKKKYKDSKKLIDQLQNEGVKIPYLGNNLPPHIFVQELIKKHKSFTKWVADSYIESRHKNIKETFLHISSWNPKFKMWFPKDEFSRKEKYTEKDGYKYQIQELEKMFYDKETGLFKQDRYIAYYYSLMNYQGAYIKRDGSTKKSDITGQFNNREISQHLLPSFNDMIFIKNAMKIKDRAQDKFTKWDLSRPEKLTQKQKDKVKEWVMREISVNSDYMKMFDNSIIESGYHPRVGHTEIQKNAEKIQELMLEIADKEMATITTPDKLDPEIRNQMILVNPERGRPLTFTEAKQLQKAKMLSLTQAEFTNSALEGQMGNELAISDLMTRDRSGNNRYIGDYTPANMHKRGRWIMPFYRLDVEALRKYGNILTKSHLTNVTGLNLEMIVKKFDRVNNVENDINALGWSGYLRDAALNMMGMSHHKPIDIHGIQEKHKPLYQSFIDNNFSTKGLKLSKAEHDLIYDFKRSIDISPDRKANLIMMHKANIEKADSAYYRELKANASRVLKRPNLTNKYGSLYHMTSDDAVGRRMQGINDALGGRLFGPLSSDPAQARSQVNEGIRYLSNLEGKYELVSLLSAPKTPITNFIGGFGNLITDVGLGPVRKSFNTEWMLKNLFVEYNYETAQMERATYEYVDPVTSKVEQKPMTNREDIFNWMDGSIGVFDTTQLQLVAVEKHFGRNNAATVVREFANRLADARASGYDMVTPASRNRLREATMWELAREYKVTESITDMGAFFMRESERILRGQAFLSGMIFHKTNTLSTPDGYATRNISFNNPGLIKLSLDTVKASQFLYQATERSNFSNTALGRVMTRFQPYAWNSIRRRLDIYRNARSVGFDYKKIASKRFQRQVSFDMFSLALANAFVASIFEYSLSPPMNWMQDTAQLLLGDEEERERAFFNQYPSKVLAPLQAVTPPAARFILPPITATINGSYDNFFKFHAATYFPFGRLGRDLYRTYQSPAMAVDFMTGLPLHRIHQYRRDQIEANNEIENIESEIDDSDV
tara:strand:- start:8149 stop:18750 length:10602 start_codon:yes stop_codon:yes gene_type:complete